MSATRRKETEQRISAKCCGYRPVRLLHTTCPECGTTEDGADECCGYETAHHVNVGPAPWQRLTIYSGERDD